MKKYFSLIWIYFFCICLNADNGIISHISGSATITRNGKKIAATSENTIMRGDKIKINEKTELSIILNDSELLKISGPAELEIPILPGRRISTIKLLSGNVWSEIKTLMGGESFKIVTPNASCGVMGTSLEVNYESSSNTTRALVNQGNIYVRNSQGKAQTLQRGMVGEIINDKINIRRDLILMTQRQLHFAKIPQNNSPEARQEAEKAGLLAQEQLENARKWQNRMEELQQKMTPAAKATEQKSADFFQTGQRAAKSQINTDRKNLFTKGQNPLQKPHPEHFKLPRNRILYEHQSPDLQKSQLLFREQRQRIDRLRILQLQTREAHNVPQPLHIPQTPAPRHTITGGTE